MTQRAGRNVVVGMDEWPLARTTLELAAAEAHRRGVNLHILHAYPWLAEARQWDFEPPAEEIEVAEEQVAQAAEHARDRHRGLSVTTEVVVLDPAAALVRASARAEVVVLGAGGHAPEEGTLGRAAQDVVAHALGPVMVVRTPPARPDGPVVVGMDPRLGAPEAMAYAFEDARRRGVGVTVVQGLQSEGLRRVWENLDTQSRRDAAVERAEQRAQTFVQEWQEWFPEVPARLEQVRDDPVDALAAASADASVVVVGSRGVGGVLGRVLGSVSREVLHRVPVAVVARAPEGA